MIVDTRTAVLTVAESVQELFEAQVDQRPLATALVCRENAWTYQEVEWWSNQLARYLRSQGIGPGSIVGIYFDRSELPIIGILATLKAGAAYVPIDACQPLDRLRHILEETSAAALLTEKALVDQASTVYAGHCIAVDRDARLIEAESYERLTREEVGGSPEDLCYVLYTSGTTGRPKGVMIEHRNVLGFVASMNEIYSLDHTDRVYHGFSLGFDASVEELWMAFSNGGALVVATADVVRVADEVAKLINEQEITVISSVPTFLAILTPELPTLKLVISGGEPFSAELVRRWARPGRRVMNTYGPTETTVDATYIECEIGRAVTIGQPLPGYEAYILDENLKPVAQGEAGELCIGGPTVARGYLGHTELTAKKFVGNPFSNGNGNSPRLYRSGDLVLMTEDGEIDFKGRIDRQVKIRGFRIELPEIESVLNDHPQISQALVEVVDRDGLKELAAYVVPLKHVNGSFDRQSVLTQLRSRLPAYMVPGYLDLIHEIPTLPSGKADRSKLPAASTPLVSSNQNAIAPSNELETKICQVWEKLFKLSPISCADDFFLDLGGHSLLAAEMVSMLRSEHGLDVAIRDLYQHATVQKLAAHVGGQVAEQACSATAGQEQAPRRTSQDVFETVPRLVRWTCYGLQATCIPLFYGAASLPLLILVLMTLEVLDGALPLAALLGVMLAMAPIGWPIVILLTVALKWLVIGRYREGEYPVWSFYYFRWWLASRIQALSGIGLLAGTPVINLYYRLMGAKIGKNVIIDTPICMAYDLVSVGDDTAIGAQTHILGYRVEDGMLMIGRIDIGKRCFVGIHSCLGIGTKMEDDTYLDDQSLLPDGEVMRSGEARRGSPAQPAEVSLPKTCEEKSQRRHPILFGVLHMLAALMVLNLLMLAGLPYLLVMTAAYVYLPTGWAVLSLFVTLPFSIVWFCVFVAGLKAVILRRPKPGTYPVESWYYLRKWTSRMLLDVAKYAMYTLYATIYLPPWLRLLGAKIGRGVEIATNGQIPPDMTVIGDDSFCADGCTIGGQRFYRGHVQLEISRIGSRTFVGNSALVPVGANMGDNGLLGVMSITPGGAGSTTPDGTEWLGSPPFHLPHRKTVEGIDVSKTFKPTRLLYSLRAMIDAMRILVPLSLGINASVAYVSLVTNAYQELTLPLFVLSIPLSATLVAFGMLWAVVFIKRLVMGVYHPIVQPLWSRYVWLNEAFTGLYEATVAPILGPMLGTPFVSWYLRMMGCRIGEHCFLETTLFGEFDLVDIGDYACVNFGVVVQNHLFEDRVMKSSFLKIGDNCNVGNMSTILYDSEMCAGSSVGSLSLLMKGETLPPHTRWLGLPTRQIKS